MDNTEAMRKEQIKIIDVALSYLNEREKKGNSGFYNEEFEQKMKAVGWNKGWAWCAFFAELVWREAYGQLNSVIEGDLRKLFSASATQTYNNFRISKKYKGYVSNKPEVGSLVVWRYGDGWQGHIGIVQQVRGKEVITIEGNTNSQGGREGIEVGQMRRLVSFDSMPRRLNLLGFIHPPNIMNH